MFGHKSFLKLGVLENASIQGLYKDSYELDSCSYGFSQGVNSDGKAQTEVRGGTIHLVIPGLPPNDIIRWGLDHRKHHDGVIVICDDNNMPLEKIKFTEALCIGLEVSYTQYGKAYISANLTLQARKIVVGEITLNNHWTGYND